MIPVLAVADPAAACRQLATELGFQDLGAGRMAFGAAQIAVVAQDNLPDGLIAWPLDHVAFQVPAVEVILTSAQTAGARLDTNFTPNGPREIAEFWQNGVRFVFFQGPEAAPFEFCTKLGGAPQPLGHSHFAIRSADLDQVETQILALGGQRIAAHTLPATPRPVNVRFIALGDVMFEVFDDAVVTGASTAWVGVLAP